MSQIRPPHPSDIKKIVTRALAEDVGNGDLTTALIDGNKRVESQIHGREAAVLCGCAWFDEVFRQLNPKTTVQWQHVDGDWVDDGIMICKITGPASALLSGERTALNFLQTLSGTATATRKFVDAVNGTNAKILDTRKTIPGLRLAQKYAVHCGGGQNHRIGLFDGVLIKENHILVAGSITAAVTAARLNTSKILIEVEVETLSQTKEAMTAKPDRILLDNMTLKMYRQAVKLRNASSGKRVELEVSGNIDINNVRQIAKTGVDYISIGAITKHSQAIDFSMRFV
ncbi:MAG TPA: carboxylating nicotinate-nucleotide diphosphorylase [Alphaproteobacteria bacterium]|nr:carboxylating nicotinate-nucleotide diphosphorylase [Alphaproteobacteria bacterium]